MKDLQKMGGIAALYEAAAYILGMVFYIFILDYSGAVEPIQKVALLVNNPASLYIMTLFVYIVFGFFLVVLALSLYRRLQASSAVMAQAATAFGLIWAGIVIASGMVFIIGMETVAGLFGNDPTQAATVWLAIESVFEGLGGGVELVGGVWILLISWAALNAGELPKVLNYLGVAIGAAGILTVIPALEMLTDVFGLSQIVWFVWLGITLLKSKTGSRA